MKLPALLAVLLTFAPLPSAETGFETVEFAAADGQEVTADSYVTHSDPKTPFIVLFHQAGWSRGEYREIAPKLGAMGFNCLAVDQRSGGEVNGVTNETTARAKQAGLDTNYPDALPDMLAAIRFAREEHAQGQLLIWGSSYSAALVLKIAGDEPELVDGVLAFAPGEYFARYGKPDAWITASARKIQVPAFITSAKSEKPAWWKIYEAIPSKAKAHFLPETDGNHGSRALWEKFADSADYWEAVASFLDENFPRAAVPIEAGKAKQADR